MKKIEAIIKPFKLEEVKTALDAIGVDGISVSEVKSSGRLNARKEVFRGTEFSIDYLPELKIELFIPDNNVERAVAAIATGGKTSKGRPHDIYVSQVESAACYSPELAVA
jgi:nitrogen regulatory protein P-II 1